MLKRNLFYPLLLLCTCVMLPVPAFAIATLSISPAGDGVFVLHGARMQEVSSFHISIKYDATTLSNPRVVMGSLASGRMAAINAGGNPIQIGSVDLKPLGGSGSGTIATITFNRTGPSAGRITGLDGNLLDASSPPKKVAMSTPVITDPNPAADQPSTDDSGNDTTATASTTTAGSTQQPTESQAASPFVVGGTLTLPSDENTDEEAGDPAAQPAQQEILERQPDERANAESAPEAGEAQDAAPKAAVPPAAVAKRIQSALERFRLFEGERTVSNLIALFSRESAASFSQVPAIMIADGQASLKVFIADVKGDKAPNFAFNSARFVSLTRVAEGEWEIEVRPEKGAVSPSVSVLSENLLQEFPLTVTSRAEVALLKPGVLAEADFQLFLKERGTASAPRFDLNGDGRRDYLDDYIFTANYLVRMQEKADKTKGAQ